MLQRLIKPLLSSGQAAPLMASTVAINVLALGSSLYSIQLLNRYTTVGLAPTLVTLTVGVLLAIGLEMLLRKQRQKVLVGISSQGDEAVSERVFTAFSTSRYAALTAMPLAARREALGAPAAMQQLGSTNNLGAVLDLPFALLFLLASSLLFWPFGVLGVSFCAMALWLGVRSERSQRGSAEAHAKASSRSQQMGQFLLAAGEAVRCLPLIGPLSRRWGDVQGESLGSRREGMELQYNLQTGIQGMGQLLTVAVYAVGAWAVVHGYLSTGALIGANILVARAFGVTSRAAYLADPLLRANRADAALTAVEALETEPQGGATPAQFAGRLEAFDVAFAYPNHPVPLFERLHVELPAGKVLVFSGRNGAGKSTLIKLMMGLLSPQRGMVRADGIELRQLSQTWWRSQVGYAPQEAVFFDGTLRENLLLDRALDDEVLLELIRELGLESFLASDPAGLDRMISSHETGLATGLRRRFVLIRAVLGCPRVVFLDDPTEGLDQAGQLAVAKLLNRLLEQGCTLVVASNEPFIQRAADMVVDMNQKPVPVVNLKSAQPTGDPQLAVQPEQGGTR